MNIIKIVWLYNDLLDLYGDGGNIAIISTRLKQMGYEVEIVHQGIHSKLNFDGASLVYIGPGRPKNLAVAAKHFVQYYDVVSYAIENNTNFLVTGNARLLFGRYFTLADGSQYNGIGIFDYTAYDTGEVFTSDVLSRLNENTNVKCYGFINRSAHIVGDVGTALFCIEKGASDGKDFSGYEGNVYKQYLGTWQLGPIMVKNPELLSFLLSRMCPNAKQEFDDSLEKTALDLTLMEMA